MRVAPSVANRLEKRVRAESVRARCAGGHLQGGPAHPSLFLARRERHFLLTVGRGTPRCGRSARATDAREVFLSRAREQQVKVDVANEGNGEHGHPSSPHRSRVSAGPFGWFRHVRCERRGVSGGERAHGGSHVRCSESPRAGIADQTDLQWDVAECGKCDTRPEGPDLRQQMLSSAVVARLRQGLGLSARKG